MIIPDHKNVWTLLGCVFLRGLLRATLNQSGVILLYWLKKSFANTSFVIVYCNSSSVRSTCWQAAAEGWDLISNWADCRKSLKNIGEFVIERETGNARVLSIKKMIPFVLTKFPGAVFHQPVDEKSNFFDGHMFGWAATLKQSLFLSNSENFLSWGGFLSATKMILSETEATFSDDEVVSYETVNRPVSFDLIV